MAARKRKKTLARDFSVRGLRPPDARTRALADRLGCEVYDSRRVAAEAGLPVAPPAGYARDWRL